MTDEESKKKRKERYWKRKESGLCIQCGKPMDNDGARCNACRERLRNNAKYMQETGHCPKCGAEIPKTRKMCAVCMEMNADKSRKFYKNNAERMREEAKQRREKKKSEGICPCCGKRELTNGRSTCEVCLAKARRKYEPSTKREMKRASGICLYCDNPAVKGYALCEVHLQEVREHAEKGRASALNKNKMKQRINAEIIEHTIRKP